MFMTDLAGRCRSGAAEFMAVALRLGDLVFGRMRILKDWTGTSPGRMC